jgi:hypothetical protein
MTKLNINSSIIIGVIVGIIVGSILTNIFKEYKLITILNIGWVLLALILLIISLRKIYLSTNGETQIQILEIKFNRNMRCLTITMNNSNTLEGRELFEEIFKTIKNNEEFRKFGNKKIIILSAVLESNQESNLQKF